MRRAQDHLGGGPGFQSFLPTGGTKAPFVPGDEPWETELWDGCRQVIADPGGKFQELLRSDDADGVDSIIPGSRPAKPIPEKSGHGLKTTRYQFFPFDIFGHACILRHHVSPDKPRIDKY